MISFQLPTGKIIHKSQYECLLIRLKVALHGHVSLGMFGRMEYFIFRCPNHSLQIDIEHGYIDGHYYHECRFCRYKFLFL